MTISNGVYNSQSKTGLLSYLHKVSQNSVAERNKASMGLYVEIIVEFNLMCCTWAQSFTGEEILEEQPTEEFPSFLTRIPGLDPFDLYSEETACILFTY